MTSGKIRGMAYGLNGQPEAMWLQEIAAQIAELNENLVGIEKSITLSSQFQRNQLSLLLERIPGD